MNDLFFTIFCFSNLLKIKKKITRQNKTSISKTSTVPKMWLFSHGCEEKIKKQNKDAISYLIKY